MRNAIEKKKVKVNVKVKSKRNSKGKAEAKTCRATQLSRAEAGPLAVVTAFASDIFF
jgi:hypothetical protein